MPSRPAPCGVGPDPLRDACMRGKAVDPRLARATIDPMSSTQGTAGQPALLAGGAPRGRFAPTPSGRMHLGNAFSALVAWLSCKSQGGRMVLRIEDLDPRAQDRRAADLIMRDLDWLGLSWDEGPYYQSNRGDLYQEAIDRLGRRGLTYPCFCTRSELHAATAPHASDGSYVYQGTCRGLSPAEVAERSRARPAALRLRVPDARDPQGAIRFCDRGYGEREEVLARECGDFLVRRSDGVVAYQLAVVVDDGLMGISEVVRGRDVSAGLKSPLMQPEEIDRLRPKENRRLQPD